MVPRGALIRLAANAPEEPRLKLQGQPKELGVFQHTATKDCIKGVVLEGQLVRILQDNVHSWPGVNVDTSIIPMAWSVEAQAAIHQIASNLVA